MMNTSSEDYTKTWSHSKMTTFKIEHIWKIDLFSDNIAPKLSSSFFSVPEHDLQFQMELYSESCLEQKFIGLYLKYEPGKTVEGDVPIKFEMAFFRNHGSTLSHGEIFATFNPSNSAWGIEHFAKYAIVMDPLNNFLHDNHQLVVCCKAIVSYNRTQVQFAPDAVINSEEKFKANLKSLLKSGEHSDFTIVVGDTQIPVHKSILAAHSSVFQALFRNKDTREVPKNKVTISDVTDDVMKDFLLFIYTGMKPKNNRLTMSLLIVAHKYQVDDLKAFCEDRLSQLLTTKNVVSYFHHADLYHASRLKAKCLMFLALNYDKVCKTKEWKEMCTLGGEKIMEICNAISSNKKESKK